LQIGLYEASVVRDGTYFLDGGAMFGVVPKVLWSKHHASDEANRIELALNCLLLRGDGRVILIDVGMGNGWSEKEQRIYGLSRPEGGLVDDLARQGVAPEDVTDVVLTHLHFDHAGGVVTFAADGSSRLTFPRAKHWVQEKHLRWAEDPTERDRRSFLSERWRPLRGENVELLETIDGPGEFLPELEAIVVNGHSSGQQLILVGPKGEQRILYCADLVPFASQVRIPWIMAFDLNPLITLQEKKEILARAATEGWILCFEHDNQMTAARLSAEDGRVEVAEEVPL
jgi:glyoxylase-like metal-dependent hydrolase (beta-lactamase superfamily II)